MKLFISIWNEQSNRAKFLMLSLLILTVYTHYIDAKKGFFSILRSLIRPHVGRINMYPLMLFILSFLLIITIYHMVGMKYIQPLHKVNLVKVVFVYLLLSLGDVLINFVVEYVTFITFSKVTELNIYLEYIRILIIYGFRFVFIYLFSILFFHINYSRLECRLVERLKSVLFSDHFRLIILPLICYAIIQTILSYFYAQLLTSNISLDLFSLFHVPREIQYIKGLQGLLEKITLFFLLIYSAYIIRIEDIIENTETKI